ncbi:hypothetical protein LF01B1_16860 [Limosilactobacillus fermentum]|uniref:Uncharacterized protein n=1 Tax=Limosilactobacillus fermentum TaxID=1613 RepID=A0ABD0ANQ3_LIMFE|nr:hypothetical protein LF01B1_16860 [Limosilactobacillus fermentum]
MRSKISSKKRTLNTSDASKAAKTPSKTNGDTFLKTRERTSTFLHAKFQQFLFMRPQQKTAGQKMTSGFIDLSVARR